MNTVQRLADALTNTIPQSGSQDDHTHAAARITSISGDYADCKLLGRMEDEESLIIRDVMISDSCKWIPVSSSSNEKIKVGDTVWIGFSDHDLSNFTGSNDYLIDSERRHDLSDGVIEAVIKHG
ncbi:hypothetical protein [Levilactobacillus senmaizukei]|nr:hypothetical protein [Levilactobacillus senmaizukei]